MTESNLPAKRPLSDAQLSQRRAAALKSTGPRTDEGKARSSRNAWKHGLRSAQYAQLRALAASMRRRLVESLEP